jgi:hypothetical protein
MRCQCCNRNLNDYESTIRHQTTGEFLDTCVRCLDGLDIPIKGREDLSPFESFEQDDFETIVLEPEDD